MSSVHAEPASRPSPVRHGRARLFIEINDQLYSVAGRSRYERADVVTIRKHGPDLAPLYAITRYMTKITCTCPDHRERGSECKHIRAVVACGLLPGRRQLGLSSAPKGGA